MRGTATQQAAKRRQNLTQGEASPDDIGTSETLGNAYHSSTHRHFYFTLNLVLIVGLSLACNRGNGGGISSGAGGSPRVSVTPAEVSSSAQVVTINPSPTVIAKGGSADADINLTVSAGYHINANPATHPYLIATEIKPGGLEGITTDKPIYPASKKQKFEFAEDPLDVYEGAVDIKLPLKASSTAATGERSLPIAVRVQACDTEKCFPPATVNARIPITVQ